MDADERNYLNELKRAHIKRLQQLRLKQAQFGYNTEPEILTEIEEIEAKIARIDKQLSDSSDLPIRVVTAPPDVISQAERKSERIFVKETPEEIVSWFNSFDNQFEATMLAQNRYVGKYIRYTGVINDGMTFITQLNIVYSMSLVVFILMKDDDQLYKIRKGKPITVVGRMEDVQPTYISITEVSIE